jgi:hypothetical protein
MVSLNSLEVKINTTFGGNKTLPIGFNLTENLPKDL